MGLFGILDYMSEILRLFSLFMGFDWCMNVFESRFLGLCGKVGCLVLSSVDVGLFGISACMSEVWRLFSLFWEFSRCVNVFESRLVVLCEKLGARFVEYGCGTFQDFSLHE